MRLSITLPTLFPDLVQESIRHIERAAVLLPCEVEIVVISPFEVRGDRILWVPEDKPAGNSSAHRAGFERSTGDYLLAMTDDHLLHEHALIDALTYYQKREERFFPLSVGLHQGFSVGTLFGIYYPYFPFMSRRSVIQAGGWYSPEFAAHFADGDLALRVWDSGGRCELCPSALIRSIPNRSAAPESVHRSKAKSSDHAVFISKWGKRFGGGWGTESVRDFNLDLPMAFAGQYLKENSLFENSPAFREQVLAYYSTLPGHNFLEWN